MTQLQMRRLVIVGAITILSSFSVVAADEKSSNSAERSSLSVSRLAKFNNAVALLDGYRGDPASLEAARAQLVGVINESPPYAPAYRELARYQIMRGHISYQQFQPGSLGAAEAMIKKALEIDPKYADACVLLGHVYQLMNRLGEGIAALEKAEKLGTTEPWLQLNWAAILIDQGKYEEAAKRYRKVIDSNTPNKKAMVSAFEGLSLYYESIGKLDEADKIYQKQIAFEPEAAWGYGNYAHFLLCQKDDYEKSIARSREALRIMDYGMGRYWLAAALYRKWAQSVNTGRPDTGAQYFAEAQAIYPDPSQIAADEKSCPPLGLIKKAIARSSKGAKPALPGTPKRL